MTVSSVTNFVAADSSPAPQGSKDSGSGDLFGSLLRSQVTPPAPSANPPPPPSDNARNNESANNNANARADDDRASVNSSSQNDSSSPPSNQASETGKDSSANQTGGTADNNQSDHNGADSSKAKTGKTDGKTDGKTSVKKSGKDDDAKNDAQGQGSVQAVVTPALTAIVGVVAPVADTPNASGIAKGGESFSAQAAAVTPAAGPTAQASANANANANAQASALTPVAPTAAGAANLPDPSKDTDDRNSSQGGKSKAGNGFGQLTADVTVVDPGKTLVSKPPATRAPVSNDAATGSNSQQDASGVNAAPGDKSAAADKTAGDGKTPSDATPSLHINSLQQLATVTGSQPPKPTTDATQAGQTSNQLQSVTNTVLAPGPIVHGPDFRTDASTLALLHGAQSNANVPSGIANLDQVAVQITKAATDGLDKINIQLKPESLGRIDVQLQVAHNGQVNAVIAAARQDTLDLLRRDASSLQQALNNAGLRADSGSLSFNLSHQGQNNLPQSFSNSASAIVPSAVLPDLPAVSPAAVAYSAAAARGGVDIQV